MSFFALWQLGGRRTIDFTLRPSQSLDVAWKKRMLPPLFQESDVSTRAHRFVSRYIAAQRPLAAESSGTGADRLVWAIVLLEPCRLKAFLLHLGALIAAQEVRQAIDKREVDAYKQVLGDELYWFLLQRAPLLAAAGLAQQRSQRHGPERIMGAIRGAAYAALSQLCDQHQPGLWDRVQLMLQDVAPAEENMCPSVTEAPALRRMATKILRELESPWASKFMADNNVV